MQVVGVCLGGEALPGDFYRVVAVLFFGGVVRHFDDFRDSGLAAVAGESRHE